LLAEYFCGFVATFVVTDGTSWSLQAINFEV